MASQVEIKKKIQEMKQTAAHFQKLASDLEVMTEVSTPVLKRSLSKVRIEMRQKLNTKYLNKKKAASLPG